MAAMQSRFTTERLLPSPGLKEIGWRELRWHAGSAGTAIRPLSPVSNFQVWSGWLPAWTRTA
jgi:hypothetical protein